MKIQKAKDSNNPTGFEQKHLPWIIVPEFIKKDEEFEVLVKVGKVDHPMTDEHYIRCIRLYIDGEMFECHNLRMPTHSETKFKVSLKKDSLITARAECNLHGAWGAEKKIILRREDNG
ncbi:MAG: desulfoferrodoxin family protein [Patescibacteria group bacterium]|nr:desulfoferrodoxin family protein [Patescibacteria group bacterium]